MPNVRGRHREGFRWPHGSAGPRADVAKGPHKHPCTHQSLDCYPGRKCTGSPTCRMDGPWMVFKRGVVWLRRPVAASPSLCTHQEEEEH